MGGSVRDSGGSGLNKISGDTEHLGQERTSEEDRLTGLGGDDENNQN